MPTRPRKPQQEQKKPHHRPLPSNREGVPLEVLQPGSAAKRIQGGKQAAQHRPKKHVSGTESNITDTVEGIIHHSFPEAATYFHAYGSGSRLLERFGGTRVVADVAERMQSLVFDPQEGISQTVCDPTLGIAPSGSFDVVILVIDPTRGFPRPDDLLRVARMGVVVAYPYLWTKSPSVKPSLVGADEDWLLHQFGKRPASHTRIQETVAKSLQGEWGVAVYPAERASSASGKIFSDPGASMATLVREAVPWLFVRSMCPRRVLLSDPEMTMTPLVTSLLRIGCAVDVLVGDRDHLDTFHAYDPPATATPLLPLLIPATDVRDLIPPSPVYDLIVWAGGVNILQTDREYGAEVLEHLHKRSRRVTAVTGGWGEADTPNLNFFRENGLDYCGAATQRIWLAWRAK